MAQRDTAGFDDLTDPTERDFHVANCVAQFLLDSAHVGDHPAGGYDALVDMARRIRTSDWVPAARKCGGS